jgi:RNA polymerase sigma-70 factor, ECF subfamily
MMKQHPAAEEMLARFAGHDLQAAGEVYDRYAPHLLGLLMQILGERNAAEEILEEVFERAWSEGRAFSKKCSSVSMALVLMARARAVERLRAGKALPPRPRSFLLRKSFAWLPTEGSVTRLDERKELLKKVANQLPKQQREMLELAVFKGLSEEEIAEKLGEPAARVKAGLLAGVRFLRHRLAAVMGAWAANI